MKKFYQLTKDEIHGVFLAWEDALSNPQRI